MKITACLSLILFAVTITACQPPVVATEKPEPTRDRRGPTLVPLATMASTATFAPTRTPGPSETLTPTDIPFYTPTTGPTPTMTDTATPQPTTTPTGNWKLVWADEFRQPDGSPPDPKFWSYDVGGKGWGNQELECYTSQLENAFIQDGNLVIRAQPKDTQGCDYTSARLVTKGKADWTYGRFEIRAILPKTRGLWPAMWLLPTDDTYGTWPNSGEIDVMELLGDNPYKLYGTVHFGSPHASAGGIYTVPGEASVPQSGASFADGYHTFALEWEPKELRWYVDGYLYFTASDWFTSSPKGQFPAPFDRRFYLLLNVAVGGVWPGNPDKTTQWPQSMRVDYVRVYQK